MNQHNLYGLVLCGGESSRMGEDKCFLDYHGKAQCYYVYEMIQTLCADTFISCNANQSLLIDKKFKIIEDIETFANLGPATGVLSAFSKYPQKDFLVIGCDYPLLPEHEINNFLKSIPEESIAAAFFDEQHQCYQPVLAWYSCEAVTRLMNPVNASQYSLKRLLENVSAFKYVPGNLSSMKSIDTKDAREELEQLTSNNH